jgi:hypothetical protein
MFIFDRRWTLDLGALDEFHLRTIVEIGALNQRRFRLSDYVDPLPSADHVACDEKAVLEVALIIGLRTLARDLEKVMGCPLDIGHDHPQGAPGSSEPRG